MSERRVKDDENGNKNGSYSELVQCACGSIGTQYWDLIDGEKYDDGLICDRGGCHLNVPCGEV